MQHSMPWDHPITNKLMGIADGLLSHFSGASGTGHWPDNSTCRFLHHQWRQTLQTTAYATWKFFSASLILTLHFMKSVISAHDY